LLQNAGRNGSWRARRPCAVRRKVWRLAGPAIFGTQPFVSDGISEGSSTHYSFTRISSDGVQDTGLFEWHRRPSAHPSDAFYRRFPGLELTVEEREGLREHGAFHAMEVLGDPKADTAVRRFRSE